MADRPDRRQSGSEVWLRIGVAFAVVVALVIVSDPFGEPDDGLSGRNSSDLGIAVKRCPAKEAARTARTWFSGMSGGDSTGVAKVTSRGEPVPRYVIEVARGAEPRTIRIGSRESAADTVPKIVAGGGGPRSFEVVGVGRPPKAGTGSGLAGRLAGVEFTAVAGDSKWSGKVGVRCGSATSYFARLRIANR